MTIHTPAHRKTPLPPKSLNRSGANSGQRTYVRYSCATSRPESHAYRFRYSPRHKASVAQHKRVDWECGTLISRAGIGDGSKRASTMAQKASVRRQFGNEIHAGHRVSLSNIQQFGIKLANAVRYRCVALLGLSGRLLRCSGSCVHRFARCSSTSFKRLPGWTVLWHVSFPL